MRKMTHRWGECSVTLKMTLEIQEMELNMMKNRILFALLLSMLVLTGCGDKVKLKGKVVFSDDGSPVPIGVVCFETDTYSARGILAEDGTFDVGSLADKDGLPPGTYRVSITGAQKVIGQDARGANIYEPLVAAKFTSGSTSGLTIDVTAATKKFEFEVDRH